jgi:hypothetical protein
MSETYTVHILGPDRPPYTEEWLTNFIPKERYDVLKDELGHLYVLYAYENGEKQIEVIKKDIWVQAKAAMGY